MDSIKITTEHLANGVICFNYDVIILLGVEKIATNPHSSFTDHEYFDVCLHKLIEHCEYNLNAPGEGMQPLLIK